MTRTPSDEGSGPTGGALGSGPVIRSARLDAVDKVLVSLLQFNGRATYSELSRQSGVSESSARTRVRRLIEDGVMQIVAVTDPLQLGFSHEAMVALRSCANPEAVAEELAGIDAIDFIVLVAGKFDVLMEVVADSDEQFLSLIQRIRDISSPATVQVLPYLQTRKQEFAWGVR
jgi:Lrp/AsnC family transcriptional regulator for asnA, asnC and gidA